MKAFRSKLLIDADGIPKRLGEVIEPWQEKDFAALDPAWEDLIGLHTHEKPIRRAWLERPRGHSKTNDVAVACVLALAASPMMIQGVAAAADEDQGKLVLSAIEKIVRLNKSKKFEMSRQRVIHKETGSTLTVISSDAGSSYGLMPDFCVVDELTHWPERGQELWQSLFSASAKRKKCVLQVITNAGFVDSWQWKIREAVRKDPAWYFSRLDGPKASWITEDRLAEQRRLLPEIAFNRLWKNEWSSGSGDAIRPEFITRATRLEGPLEKPKRGWVYVAGADLGLRRDASSVVVVGIHRGIHETRTIPPVLTDRQRILIDAGVIPEPPPIIEAEIEQGTDALEVAEIRYWKPEGGKSLDISVIEEEIIALDERFKLEGVFVDRWQAEFLIQRLLDRNIPAEGIHFSAEVLKTIAQEMMSSFSESRLALFPHEQLRSDLANLRIVERSYGIRLESPRGTNGHGDTCSALGLALLATNQIQSKPSAPINGSLVIQS